MITVLPVSSLAVLSLIEFLSRSAGNQLNRFCNNVFTAGIPDKKMDVIGGNRVTENAQAITLFCLKKPAEPPASISAKFQKEFLLMASVGKVPYIARYVMPACPWHGANP